MWFIHRVIRELYRWGDRGFTCNKLKTKKKSLKQYIDLYNGEEFELHCKYSAILNICFVTFIYGFGLPLLFPLAMLLFSVMFLMENTLLYYSYR